MGKKNMKKSKGEIKMNKKDHIIIRIDADVKKDFAEKVEAETGLNTSQWLRMKITEFLKEGREK